jgi:predicted alpha/beta superfamily hydrolase
MRYEATRVSDDRHLSGTIMEEEAEQAFAEIATLLPKGAKDEDNVYEVVLVQDGQKIAKRRVTAL